MNFQCKNCGRYTRGWDTDYRGYCDYCSLLSDDQADVYRVKLNQSQEVVSLYGPDIRHNGTDDKHGSGF